ncbi:MAG: hypothetical protein J7L69_08730 [Desulfobulbaceae bacterium]|nr:hypothetical protein [Desulfobulbaceae bacterium]
MKTINRTVLFVTPKQPYVDWANSFDDGGPQFSADRDRGTAILIPDTYDEYNYENWVKKNWREIFEQELEAWMVDTDCWPEKLTYKMFKQWFTVLVADTVIDLGRKPIEIEEF